MSTITGELEIDSEAGVIYFNDNGVTLLRISGLPRPIPEPVAGKSMLDVHYLVGASWPDVRGAEKIAIETTGLKAHTVTVLWRNGIRTLGDVIRQSNKIRLFSHVGPVTIDDINRVLEKHCPGASPVKKS